MAICYVAAIYPSLTEVAKKIRDFSLVAAAGLWYSMDSCAIMSSWLV